ncbi:hypothetical protein V5799_010079 [Amblyomma americanum]|uniref:Uncharacterized protein n=1 Tax=Amblyomma americanum TaxID=6943 RepID=A0AAQ4F8N4_AMBAM
MAPPQLHPRRGTPREPRKARHHPAGEAVHGAPKRTLRHLPTREALVKSVAVLRSPPRHREYRLCTALEKRPLRNHLDRVLQGLKSVHLSGSVKKEADAKKNAFRRPSRASQPEYPLTFGELCSAALVVALVTAGVMLWRHRRAASLARLIGDEDDSAKDTVRCESDSCSQLQEILDLSMDSGADPCHDMHQYVCGGWGRRKPGLSIRFYTQAGRRIVERL